MAYKKTTWTDRVVQHAKRYALSLISGSTYDIDAAPGTVTEAGTGITAARMNNIETGIYDTNNSLGRYNSEFGFNGAVYSTCGINANGEVDLDNAAIVTTVTQDSNNNTTGAIYGNNAVGQRLDGTFTATIDIINSISVWVQGITGSPTSMTVSIYDETSASSLGSVTVLSASISTGAYNVFTFASPIAITAGNIIQVRINAAGDASNYYTSHNNTSSVQNNAFFINTTNNWSTKTDTATWDLRYKINYTTTKSTSGTCIKTITPVSLAAWGNLKFTKTTPENTVVTCDILDASDNVLLAEVTSIADLSTINITSYPTVKIKYTLTRNAITYTTPSVSNTSVTWDGSKYLTASATYDPVSLATMTSTSTTVTVTGAALGDFVEVSFSLDRQLIITTAYVSATNTVTIGLINHTAGTIDLSSGTIKIKVWRY